jgi:Kef-type K+ transport system membrane component KefB
MAAAVLVASMLSVRLAITVAVVEIVLGVVIGNALHVQTTGWIDFMANLGSVLLIFLAGLEVQPGLLRRTLHTSVLMGVLAFLIPFAAAFSYCFWVAGWTLRAAEIGGIALATTAVAVVYTTLADRNLQGTEEGKVMMAAAFVTDFVTVVVLSALFAQATWGLLFFLLGSVIIIAVSSPLLRLFRARYGRAWTSAPDIKLILAILIAILLLAELGNTHATLAVFVLGFVLSKWFDENPDLRRKLQILAFGLLTPFFFLRAGMSVSLGAVSSSIGLIVILFAIQVAAKMVAVLPLARRYLPGYAMFTSLLMSTGLTFGTIAALFGLQGGYIDRRQFSVLTATVIATAIIPTVIAQRWFQPSATSRSSK